MSDEHEETGDPIYDDPQRWKPGTFGYHELLDRVRLVADLWWDKVGDHPSAKHDPDLAKPVEEIGDLMESLYQKIGSLSFQETKVEATDEG